MWIQPLPLKTLCLTSPVTLAVPRSDFGSRLWFSSTETDLIQQTVRLPTFGVLIRHRNVVTSRLQAPAALCLGWICKLSIAQKCITSGPDYRCRLPVA